MQHLLPICMVFFVLSLSGYSSSGGSAVLGALGGAGAGGYEYHLKNKRTKLKLTAKMARSINKNMKYEKIT